MVCVIPFFDKKFLNSALAKLGPLSVTMVFGRLNWEKNDLKHSIVADEVEEFITWVSIPLEWESIKTNNILTWIGPLCVCETME